jgi:hypothetical protein
MYDIDREIGTVGCKLVQRCCMLTFYYSEFHMSYLVIVTVIASVGAKEERTFSQKKKKRGKEWKLE